MTANLMAQNKGTFSLAVLAAKVQNQGVHRALLPPEALGQNLSFSQLLVAPGIPGLMDALMSSPPVSGWDSPSACPRTHVIASGPTWVAQAELLP